MNFNTQPIGNEAHHARRFHPWNLLQLLFALVQRNEEDVAADIAAHYFHNLGVRHVLDTGEFNLIAGINPETPRVLAVAVEAQTRCAEKRKKYECQGSPQQARGRLFRKRSAADGDALLPAQKWGFLFGFEIN